ncbi:histidine-specific methyltransferase [Hypoxylon rubiginosum]|uniref:Histidine-specific methyltransferase n=1 Tax=Hypoxylon rubiginosum TaxID=110542 RepID=A0ACB9YSW3_9PEZI|nr:histidine-specific methyltransferase [Hypoxylon rubiginosum]
MNGLRSLPSLLLWNEQGLRYFEQVTYTPEYYLTNTEIELLREHSLHLARNIEPGAIILELGSGCLRKTSVLLQAIEGLGKQADYYALDLDLKELDRTLQELEPSRFTHVSCHGLLGTYDDGKVWLAQGVNGTKPKYVLSLGSTIGSFNRTEASDFLRQWADVLRRRDGGVRESPDAKIIISLDGCKDHRKVWAAYNDKGGANKRFILNVLENANAHLGYKAFDPKDWTVRGEWDVDGGRHVQYILPLRDLSFEGHHLHEGEKVLVVYSYKFDEEDKRQLWGQSRLKDIGRYMNDDESYGLHVLSL